MQLPLDTVVYTVGSQNLENSGLRALWDCFFESDSNEIVCTPLQLGKVSNESE